ncbi:MAG: hypothetical protein AAFR61_25885 [Bacteroidota bacterium]
MRNLIFSVLSFCLTLAFFSSLSGQHVGNVRYNNAAIKPPPPQQWEEPKLASRNPHKDFYQFEVKVLNNVQADAYAMIYNLTQLGKSAEEADSLMQARIRPFMQDCLDMGIKREDFFIDMVTQVPLFDLTLEKKRFNKKTYREVPLGIEVQKNIHVRFSDGKILDQINTAAARYDIFDLVKVDYFVKDIDRKYQEMRKKAIAYHQEVVETFAALGLDPEEFDISFVDQTGVHYPLKRYQDYEGFGAASLEKVREQDKVNQVRKPRTMYYQKLSDEAFNVVLNPIAYKPMVQYTYHLRVNYQRKPKKPKPVVKTEIKREKQFNLVTPEGKVVPLFVKESTDKE